MVSEINPFDVASGKVVINHNGTFWFKGPGNNMHNNGWPIDENLHRDNDLPAVIYRNGGQEWWKNGDLCRDNDQPSMVWADGSQWWYRDGRMYPHNDPLPIINPNWFKESLKLVDNTVK